MGFFNRTMNRGFPNPPRRSFKLNAQGPEIGKYATIVEENSYLVTLEGESIIDKYDCVIVGSIKHKFNQKQYIGLKLGSLHTFQKDQDTLWSNLNNLTAEGTYHLINKDKFFQLCNDNIGVDIIYAPIKKFTIVSLKESYLANKLFGLYEK